jgi:hypothetical protein
MAPRIGFYTLRKLGQQMCKYIVQFSPAIQQAYPNNGALHAALAAALAACSVLDQEIALEQEPGV